MDINARMRAYFNELAEEWSARPEEKEARERLVELAELQEKWTVADVGCGRGVLLPHLLERDPASIVAIDLSDRMIELGRIDHPDPRIDWRCGDLLIADLPRLDAAILYNCYPHFLDKAALARKLTDCIRPGGVVLVGHGRGKETINGRHRGSAFPLSVPLRHPVAEAAEFAGGFTLDTWADSTDFYYFRLTRG